VRKILRNFFREKTQISRKKKKLRKIFAENCAHFFGEMESLKLIQKYLYKNTIFLFLLLSKEIT
jgi:hypothetical protein